MAFFPTAWSVLIRPDTRGCAVAADAGAAALIAGELGRNESWVAGQVESFTQLAGGYLPREGLRNPGTGSGPAPGSGYWVLFPFVCDLYDQLRRAAVDDIG